MFVNILSTAMCEEYLSGRFGRYSILVSLGVMTPLILVFGEIAPKIIAFRLKRVTVPAITSVIRLLYFILYPFQYVIFVLSNPFVNLFATLADVRRSETPARRYNNEDISAAVAIGSTRAIFDEYEQTLIRNIARFDSITARYILTPRTRMFTVDIQNSLAVIEKNLRAAPYSRVPVCDGAKDNIIGVFIQKDIFSDAGIFADRAAFRSRLREAYFVPETVRASKLFRFMVDRKTHIHFVVDEYGGLEGLVTLEDVLAEVFGDISDRHRRQVMWDKADTPGVLVARPAATLEELSNRLGVTIEDDDAVTLGGFITNRLGRLPEDGDRIRLAAMESLVVAGSDPRSFLVEIARLPGRGGASC